MSHEPVPELASNEEEAAWWYAHPEILTEPFQTARQHGHVRRLSQTDLSGASETATIHRPQQELTCARELAAKRGVTIETSGDISPTLGSEALLLQLTTNLVHNAIVHNLPEGGTVW